MADPDPPARSVKPLTPLKIGPPTGEEKTPVCGFKTDCCGW
jgi:hypothetical protein